MLRLVQRLAIAAARLDAWEAKGGMGRSRLAVLPYLPLVILPFLVAGLHVGIGVNTAALIAAICGLGPMFVLPRYGRKLLGTPTLAHQVDAARHLVEGVSSRLAPRRLADAHLLLDVEQPEEAIGLVLDDLVEAGTPLDERESQLVVEAARRIELDKEARTRLEALGIQM